jgi:F0F1-type ATP synthase delta subunit
MQANYVQAMVSLLTEGQKPDVVVAGLVRTLEARGHSRLLRSILTETVRTLEVREISTRPKLVVAREEHTTKEANAIKSALLKLKEESEPLVSIDDTIIGGFIVESNHIRLDHSYKTSLINLYRNITN